MKSIDSRPTGAAASEYGVVIEPGTVRLERDLPGPIERVWAYLTESSKRARWLAAGPMDLRVGGRVELVFNHDDLSEERTPPSRQGGCDDSGPCVGTITACDPPVLLSYTWGEASGDESEVSFELSRQDDRVRLVVTHRRLSERSLLVGVASGWHTHLGVLVDHLEGARTRPFWTTFSRLEAEYEKRIP